MWEFCGDSEAATFELHEGICFQATFPEGREETLCVVQEQCPDSHLRRPLDSGSAELQCFLTVINKMLCLFSYLLQYFGIVIKDFSNYGSFFVPSF